MAWAWGVAGGAVAAIALRLFSLPWPWLILAVLTGFLIAVLAILTWAPPLDSRLWKHGLRPGVSGAFTLRVVAKYLPEYIGLDDKSKAHIILVRDCIFTNVSNKKRSSVQLHLAVQRSSQSGWFYYDDPLLSGPQGYLRNPLNLPPSESVRGHFLLLLNPLIVPFASQPSFPKSFSKSMESGEVSLVMTNLFSGEVAAVRIPTNG